MRKVNIAKLGKSLATTAKKHSPQILTGVGVAGMITTVIFAVKETPKAFMLIEEKKNEEMVDKLPPIETVKLTWKCYIPAAVIGTLSIACIIGASSVSTRRHAALMTAYTLSESAAREYKDKIIETIGGEKEREVRKEIVKDKVEKNPPEQKHIVITGDGDYLCYDAYSGRYFRSDKNKIEAALNKLNSRLTSSMYASLNDFYYFVGLDENELGSKLGWDMSKYDWNLLDLDFSHIGTSDGTPVLAFSFSIDPQYNFDMYE